MTFLCQVLLGSLVVALTLQLSPAMDICKEKDKDGFKLKLLGTALFKDYLLLITRDDNHQDYTVYKIPLSNFDNSYGQMLLDIPGTPIEDYWPAFKNDTNWKEIRGNVLSIWLIDKVKPFMYFMVPEGQQGNGLNVETGEWIGGLGWGIHHHIATQIVSNADVSHTYSNKCVDDLHRVYLLYRWNVSLNQEGQFSSTGYRELSHLYYTENKKTKQVENITFMYNYQQGSSIVTPETDPYLAMPGYEDYHLVNLTDWNVGPDFVPPGFIFKGQFHMFCLEKVFIFADRLTFEDPGLKLGQIWYTTPVKAVSYKDYFKCQKARIEHMTYPPEVPPVSLGSSGGSLVWLWILILILVGLLLLCLFLWMCCRKKKSKDHHHRGSGGGSHKKRSSHSRKSSRGPRGASSLKRNTSIKRPSSVKRNSTKRQTISKLSHGTRRSGLKAK